MVSITKTARHVLFISILFCAIFVTVAVKPSRSFLPKWNSTYQWLTYDSELDKAFCSICKTAYEVMKIPSKDESSLKAFATTGFSTWKNATANFNSHQTSQNHRFAATAIISRKNDTNISGIISRQAQQSREDARFCLLKIFETIRFLAVQDIPTRHTEEESNFIQLVKLRCLDIEKLRLWMDRPTYKWISHDIINEIVSILARQILDNVVNPISEKKFFAFMADETTDISRKEQMSANFRVVDDNMEIHEVL